MISARLSQPLAEAIRQAIRRTPLGWLASVLALAGAPAGAGEPGSPGAPDGPYRAFGYPWENNSLGMERIVPAPWTPVSREAGALRVWGRTFHPGGVLPGQVTARDSELFAAPPRLDLVVDGAEPLARARDREWLETADDRVRWRTTAAGRGCRVEAEVTVEYDGLWLVSLTVTPEREARLERLVVELPWRKSVAQFYSRYVRYDYDRQSVDPADFFAAFGRLDRPVRFPFNPTVWVGNHDVGAEWICETDEGWSPRRAPQAVTLEPGAGDVRMRVNIVTEPVTLRQPYRLTFGLLPTPVKPLPDDWRRVRLSGARGGGFPFDPRQDRVYSMNHPAFTIKYRGLPELVPARPAAQVRDPSGVRYMPYGTLYGMPSRLPRDEWRDYAPFWETGNPLAQVRNPNFAEALGLPKGSVSIIHVSTAPKSFRDFLVWEHVQALERWGVDGLYWDFGSPHHASRNREHPGGAWVAQGGQFFPLLAQRDLMKRAWVALKSRRPDFLLMLHQVQTPVVVSGFADVILTGEALNRVFKAPHWTVERARTDLTAYVPDYSQVPDVMWEAQYSQRRGFISMLLSQVVKWNDDLMAAHPEVCAERTRTLLARTLVHDVSLSYMRNHRPTLDAVIAAQRRFAGFDESRFVGPWESASFLRRGGGKLKVGAHLAPEGGRCLLVVSNLGNAPVTETLALRPGVGGSRVVDALTGRFVAHHSDTAIELTLEPNEFRLLLCQ